MLKSLKIKNFAILRDNEVLFDKGLNIISGETASGKSLILKAIKFVCGEKIEKDITGNLADVQAMFDVSENHKMIELLKENDLYQNDDLILRRLVNDKGSKIYINGVMSSSNILSIITDELLNLCGQNDNVKIINPKNQLKILDQFAKIDKELLDLRKIVEKYNELSSSLRKKEELEKEKDQKIEMLKYQLKDLEALKISRDEEKEINDKIKEAQQYKAKNDICKAFFDLMSENDVSSNLGELLVKMNKIDSPDIEDLKIKMSDAVNSIDHLFSNFSKYKKGIKNSDDMDALASKLDIINKINKKYGSIDALFIKRDALKAEMKMLDENTEEIARQKTLKNKLLSEYNILASKISSIRKEKSKMFCKSISEELQELNMKGASFDVKFDIYKEPNVNGMDKIEFLVTTNKGFDLKPMGKIASGGELSRIMLSINKISNTNQSLTLVFDEIDSGIGGETGNVVGQKMNQISQSNQVICISHLPQVSVYSNNHIVVHKEDIDNRSASVTRSKISQDEKLKEIARMIAGNTEKVSSVLKLAREMINNTIVKED